MPALQPSKLRLVPESPLRSYAQTAVAVAAEDQVRGVLTWRVAEFLLLQALDRSGQPARRLAAAPPNERMYFLQLARGILGEVDRIDQEPPTPSEILRFKTAQSLALAQGRAKLEAEAQGHRLDVWRPTIDDPGSETAFCRRCHAGVSIHLDTTLITASSAIAQPCPQTGVQR